MAILEKLEKLCYENGESLNGLAAQIGVASSTVTGWNQGSTPRKGTLKKIADHFGVTVDFLLSDEATTPSKWDSRKETSEYGALSSQEKQIIDMYRELTEMGKMRMLSAILRVYDEETNR